jgi:WD40 repeat protein/serine/threonine protein kinase
MQDNVRVREILEKASELPASERAAYLDAACEGSPEMRAEIDSLLDALLEADEFLVRPTMTGARSPVHAEADSIGSSIGPYRLVEKIGEGGMGIVYLAEQDHPVQRRVALKIIKPGMDSNAIVARFEAERQALALMDHSNIARVYDAGATENGRPYFVMEFIQGAAVTTYCDENRLPPEQRLELFITICQAVQHAHQKGIIHRDLKPSNVLITKEDGRAVVKVIDFGVAKAVSLPQPEISTLTQFGTLVGTFEYMSPEQAGGDPEQTDTRTDIYAMGVILYELLTGATPLDRRQFQRAGYEQMMRTIRDVEPPRPSDRLSRAGEDVAGTSALRRMDPRKLVKLLSGDLDLIVMKCLEKDRERRYESVGRLGQDIARFLNDEPVEAKPPSKFYLLSKFARRHKTSIAVSAAVLLVVLISFVTTLSIFWILKNEAARQRDSAIRATAAAQSANHAESLAMDQAIASRNASETSRVQAEYESYCASIYAASAAVQSGNLADAEEFLKIDPPALRNWEWNYLHAVANPQKLTLQFESIDGSLYHKDRSELSVTFGDRSVHFFDIRTGRELRAISNLGPRGLRPFAISPDEQRLIAERRDGSICVLGRDGEELASIPLASQRHTYVYSTRFTRDHLKFITSCRDDKSVRIRETATCRELLRLQGHSGLVVLTALSADESKLLTSSNEGTAQVWEMSTGKLLSTYHAPGGGWAMSAISADGKKVLTVSTDMSRQGVIWDAETGNELLSITEGIHTNANMGVNFSPDGNMVAISGGRFANVFDAHTGHLITMLQGHHGRVPGVEFIGDGSELLTGANDNSIRIWDLHPRLRPLVIGDPQHPIVNARFTTDAALITTDLPDHTVGVCNAATGEHLATLDANAPDGDVENFSVNSATGADNQCIAVPARDGSIGVFNPSTGRLLKRLGKPGPQSSAGLAVVTHDGKRVITQSVDGLLHLWDLFTGEVTTFGAPSTLSSQVIVNPQDNRVITSPGNGDAKLWDLPSGRLIGTLSGHSKAFFLSDDGRNISTPQQIQTSQGSKDCVFSHDGKSIATSSGLAAVIYDAATGHERYRLPIGHAVIHSVAFSPDDARLVVSCQDDTAEIWDLRTLHKVRMLWGHQGCVVSACYSPDGSRILTASVDATARIWDSKSGRALLVLQGHSAALVNAEFSGDGVEIVTLSEDGIARIWNSMTNEAIAAKMNRSPARP